MEEVRALSFSNRQFHILGVFIVMEEEDRCCEGVTRRCETRENWVLFRFNNTGKNTRMSVKLDDSQVLEHFGKIRIWNMEYGTVYEGSAVTVNGQMSSDNR